MRITFVLPSLVRSPVGSHKAAYEFSNRLTRHGHDVRVLHVELGPGTALASRARRWLRFRLWQLGLGRWFALDRRIRTGGLDPHRLGALPNGDALIAIGWNNSRLVNEAPATCGRKSYLVQGYMAPWEGAPGEVDDAWRLPLRKIVISRWLEERCREICGPSADVVRISIAIDSREFSVRVKPEDRQPASIAMLYHPAPYKGAADAFAALEAVRSTHPELNAVAFGTQRPASPIPEWVRFEYRPRDISAVYNSAAIFLHSSTTEGWPLPPAEAMSSGCALVAAANEGVRDYAVDSWNALLAPPGDPVALAAALRRLIEDDQLRLRLAHQGVDDIRVFDWETATNALERAIGA